MANYGSNKEDYIDFDTTYAAHKRMMRVCEGHKPGDKWPDEPEFNYTRRCIKDMLAGIDGKKYTKGELIEYGQEWYKEILAAGIYNEAEELALLAPFAFYMMAGDLPD